MESLDPTHARAFAVQLVQKLTAAGYQALWAGGCVRDQCMGREPKDYDIATNATPEQIRQVFGQRRTLAIGASFGVITVLGPASAGRMDVATFRRDGGYSDGRHPDGVVFSTADQDAQRRDFTINGLFFDPLREEIIDYVGGLEDLRRGVIRAIGRPADRFTEDKLRMLRAVRFATTLSFDLDPETLAAVQTLADEIRVVSAERVAEELRKMLVHPARHRALELLRQTRLLPVVLPHAATRLPQQEPATEELARSWDRTIRILERLRQPTFAVALATVLREAWRVASDPPGLVQAQSANLRLSRDEQEGIGLVLQYESPVRQGSQLPWPTIQRILVHPRIEEVLALAEAAAEVESGQHHEVEWCRQKLQLPVEILNPAPLVTGEQLKQLGIPPGPAYRELLERTRDAQLTGLLGDREAALVWVRALWLERYAAASGD